MLDRLTLRLWHVLAELEEKVGVILGDNNVLLHQLELRNAIISYRVYHIQHKCRKWLSCVQVPSSGAGVGSKFGIICNQMTQTYCPARVLSNRDSIDHPRPVLFGLERRAGGRNTHTLSHPSRRSTQPESLLEHPHTYLDYPWGPHASAPRQEMQSPTRRDKSTLRRGAYLQG